MKDGETRVFCFAMESPEKALDAGKHERSAIARPAEAQPVFGLHASFEAARHAPLIGRPMAFGAYPKYGLLRRGRQQTLASALAHAFAQFGLLASAISSSGQHAKAFWLGRRDADNLRKRSKHETAARPAPGSNLLPSSQWRFRLLLADASYQPAVPTGRACHISHCRRASTHSSYPR